MHAKQSDPFEDADHKASVKRHLAASKSRDGERFSLRRTLPVFAPVAAVLLVATAVIGYYLPLTRDEIWHWPAALLFGGGLPSIEVLAAYFSGPGPLPYIIWGNLHALGADLWLLRVTSMIFLLVAAAGLFLLLREINAPNVFIPAGFILLQPYVFLNGFLLMSDSLALALAVWSLYFIHVAISEGRLRQWGLATLLMVGLLYTRQPYVIIPVGLLAVAPLLQHHRNHAIASSLVSFMAVGPLLALWGGYSTLTRSAAAGWGPKIVNHLVAWLGFSFWPYVLTRKRWQRPSHPLFWLVPFLFSGLLVWGFMSLKPLPGSGLMSHAVVLSSRLGGELLAYAILYFCWAVGAIICSHTVFRAWERPERRPLLIMAVFGFGLMAVTHAWKERHALPVHILVCLLAWSEPFEKRWLVLGWLVATALLAVALLSDTVLEATINRELLTIILGVGGA